MFDTVLIANRGAIATRIIRSLDKLGIDSVAIFHEQDRQSLHVQRAKKSICLGAGSATQTYLNIDVIIDAAKQSGAQAIHPGYGFLSENTEFVKRCEQEGLVFIGPRSEHIELFGLKHQAREAAQAAGVALVPGSPLLQEQGQACAFAADIGYPVMLKSTAGGGGIGMQVCHSDSELRKAWSSVKRLSQNYFANDGVFIEKYIARARHLEVQILGDGSGQALSFGERDCSAQRRNQKVIEETPAPNLSDELRHALCSTAERLMTSVNYLNAGTVEFIFDVDSQRFYFLEVNTRLQVEHGITEEVWGIDLVEQMLLIAAEQQDFNQLKNQYRCRGHALQVRIYAEDSQQDFRPSAGLLSKVDFAKQDALRVDTWVESGTEVPALFDPMLAKLICHAENREQSLAAMQQALANTTLYGIETNSAYVQAILASAEAITGQLLTSTLANFSFSKAAIRVEAGGTMSTVQDWPGRSGLWHIGVPPSGPMDSASFRLANLLVGNSEGAAALELTLNGPSLRFLSDASIALCGAAMQATLDGQNIEFWQKIEVRAGQLLELGNIIGAGARSYLAVAGSFLCPDYLGSKSTFSLGQFGGHNGRALAVGDVLPLGQATNTNTATDISSSKSLAITQRPFIDDSWQIRVVYGPHGAPDFFTDEAIDEFFSSSWQVHYNSSRTGVRLIGPKPSWARETGGEAGLHPSNIHDNAYAFGSIDFTGDMPVILGPDGPSLGGFVCPATVIQADLWKLGQLKAGASVRFIPVSLEQAVKAEQLQQQKINKLSFSEGPVTKYSAKEYPVTKYITSPIVFEARYQQEKLCMRAAGDHFLLVELGPLELDIERRFKIHALMLKLEQLRRPGMRELTPGIRSLQIHYDSQQLSCAQLCQLVKQAAEQLEENKQNKLPSRIIYLPLSWDDSACREAIEKYTQSVRPGAPWCPSNLEFIRRINGLDSVEAVKDIVFDANYLVMGLGDVYLGAPVATPIDPTQRLVTTKYNPARTWTAENSVGIGGAYMCVYGMEGPGGYQFVGRTLQMWNRYRKTREFEQPWLLRFFDQIKFYPVSHAELEQIRRDFPLGKYQLRIEEQQFCLDEYKTMLRDKADEIAAFQQLRQAAFERELEQWRIDGQLSFEAPPQQNSDKHDEQLPEQAISVDSPVAGSVWQVQVNEGQQVEKGQVLMVLESMKMEIEIHAPCAARILKVHRQQGQALQTGSSLFWLEASNV
ncbi:urea carboxylase [Agaribacterium haliotis]|uniref:urea carboxylase n=1 Tax=Agaribacterium haliotis TaxID=2013869 RepID=UPI000BB5535E|nr:urea carboxylase [Agaribacterium haliotis]